MRYGEHKTPQPPQTAYEPFLSIRLFCDALACVLEVSRWQHCEDTMEATRCRFGAFQKVPPAMQA